MLIEPKLYEVGGCVRDKLMGVKTKDIDFAVEFVDDGLADGEVAFGAMSLWLDLRGFEVFVVSPEYFTIRAHFPRHTMNPRWQPYRNLTADFVLCRIEGPYSDGRHPDWVHSGTIADDLRRRDFTVNAMARELNTETLIDPHGGRQDLELRILRCVGTPWERLSEDALRALRAIRFAVTKDFRIDHELWEALCSAWLPNLLDKVSTERKREELLKAMHHDTLRTLSLLSNLPKTLTASIFSNGLWLRPTLEK